MIKTRDWRFNVRTFYYSIRMRLPGTASICRGPKDMKKEIFLM
jgi:hypothetical protein